MNDEQITLIRQSFRKIPAEAFAESFYHQLFSSQPALRLLFPDDFGEQRKKLWLMLEAAVEMLDDPERLVPALEESGRRHALYGAREEHYETVNAALLAALRETSEMTGDTETAWRRLAEEMSEIMKRGARRLADAPEEYPEKNAAEKTTMKIQNAMLKTIRIFLMAVVLGFVSAGAAHAETIFAANMSGQGQVPPTATTGKGFAVVVLNDAETQADYQVYFSNLLSPNDTGNIHFPGTPTQNVFPSIPLNFTNGPSTINLSSGTVSLTPQEVQQLKNGLWYVQINSAGFPSGEIRGQFYPYSPFIANMTGEQTVPDGASAAVGVVYLAVSRDQSMIAYYYRFRFILNLPAKVSVFSGMPGQNGTWDLDLSTPESAANSRGIGVRITSGAAGQELIGRLKRGVLYAVVTSEADYPRGEIRGQLKAMNKITDFDGDGRSDIAVYREGTGVWYQMRSLDYGIRETQFGLPGDIPAHADYDGDGITDIAVYRAGTGQFFMLRSSDRTMQIDRWGGSGDKPAPADFDGDGKADYVISRLNGQQKQFWIMGSLNGAARVIEFGLNGDQFLPADFDGDRVNDLTVYRPGNQTFYSILSSNGQFLARKWGTAGDIPKIADVDGDGKSEHAVYRTAGPDAGTWWILYSTGVVTTFKFGLGMDRPVPADYDGDGRIDFAIYREGSWWLRKSSNGSISTTNFGLPNDLTTAQ